MCVIMLALMFICICDGGGVFRCGDSLYIYVCDVVDVDVSLSLCTCTCVW